MAFTNQKTMSVILASALRRQDKDHWPSAETVRQPTADLAEVTSLSPGWPPSRLPRERDLHLALNPEGGAFRWQGDAARWSHKPDGRCGTQS
jgi:hypothetical protein